MEILCQKKHQIHLKQNKKKYFKNFWRIACLTLIFHDFHDIAMKKMFQENLVTLLLLVKTTQTYILLDGEMSWGFDLQQLSMKGISQKENDQIAQSVTVFGCSSIKIWLSDFKTR